MLPRQIEDLGGRKGRASEAIEFNVIPGLSVIVPSGFEFEIGVGFARLPLDYNSALTMGAALHDYLYGEWGIGRHRLSDAVMLSYLEIHGWRGPRLWIAWALLCACGKFRARRQQRRITVQMKNTPSPKGRPR